MESEVIDHVFPNTHSGAEEKCHQAFNSGAQKEQNSSFTNACK